MKIDRLIGIIMILLQRDKATVAELAERFEVSARTINRDVEDICKAGLPLVTVQGRSVLSEVCRGVVFGFGAASYLAAMEGLKRAAEQGEIK